LLRLPVLVFCPRHEFVAACHALLYVVTLLRRQLSEDKARWLFQQLIFAIDYCHRKGVLRRAFCTELMYVSCWVVRSYGI
jgi:serine/threonine protein kinase